MRKKDRLTSFLIIICIIGAGLLLYPLVSDYWNSFRQTRVINNYQETVEEIDNSDAEAELEAARAYNKTLSQNETSFSLTEDQKKTYESLLNYSDGVMGYIEIPEVDISLPIYHGTEESALQVGAGHMEWSSLPVGGVGTHAVLTGHRGLPSSKLFTDLDKLEKGDTFLIKILNETLTYEIDQILITEPEDLSALAIDPEEDFCTLVTCTPYGINTQRLLIRGHRIENALNAASRITSEGTLISPALVAPFLAVPILVILLLLVLRKTGGKNEKK